jgi:hypothetical protein
MKVWKSLCYTVYKAQDLETYLPAEMQSLSRRSRGAVGSLNVTGEDTSLLPAISAEIRSVVSWVISVFSLFITVTYWQMIPTEICLTTQIADYILIDIKSNGEIMAVISDVKSAAQHCFIYSGHHMCVVCRRSSIICTLCLILGSAKENNMSRTCSMHWGGDDRKRLRGRPRCWREKSIKIEMTGFCDIVCVVSLK